MPGPVVNGVRQVSAQAVSASVDDQELGRLPLMSEGTIRLLLLNSGEVLIARLRSTTDRDGQPAYQLIRPRRVVVHPSQSDGTNWTLEPYLQGLMAQANIVLFKHALASVLEPEGRLLQIYAEETSQECPLEETPVERLKRAFQEFTDSLESA